MKNNVICLDGTSNEVKAHAVTNVFKIVELLKVDDPASQVVDYDPGIATMAAPGAWRRIGQKLSILGGLALDHGIRENMAETYTYLMNTWKPLSPAAVKESGLSKRRRAAARYEPRVSDEPAAQRP